ncbi:hypothetical protein [Flavobacterium sp.]|uniref:hypothetical protein n=1 Tax=Flavobacterium sp. TaxID=239 RepID=UPI00391DA290
MKTNFFKNVKLLLFLLFAAFGSFVGTAQTSQPNVIISPIGGKKTPDPGPYTNFTNLTFSGKIFFVDIGGRSTGGEFSISDIGGKGSASPTPFSEMRIRQPELSPITKLVVIGGKKGSGPVLITNGVVLFNLEPSTKPLSNNNYSADVGLGFSGFSLPIHV